MKRKIETVKNKKLHNYKEKKHRKQLPWILPLKRPNYNLPKIRFKLSMPQIPLWLYKTIIAISIFYIFSGAVYLLVQGETRAFFINGEGEVELIYSFSDCEKNLRHQFIFEGIVAGLCMFMGSIGLFIMYSATKDPHNPNHASNLQFLGVILLFISFLILSEMMHTKKC